MTGSINALYVKSKTLDDTNDPGAIAPNLGAWTHQVSVDPVVGSATIVTGTIALSAIPYGASTPQAILDETGAAVVFDLATPEINTVIIEGVFSSFKFTPTDVVGSYVATAFGK